MTNTPALLPLDDIAAMMASYAARLDKNLPMLPSFGRSAEDGSPHIEMDSAYHFIVREKGQEITRKSTTDIDELLFWSFSVSCFAMASAYEVNNRVEGEDFRRQLFSVQLQLLALINPRWAEMQARDHKALLQRMPFADGPRHDPLV